MANEIEKIDFVAQLNDLVDGLYVMSETDAPLKPFVWKKIDTIDDALLLKKAKVSPETCLEKWTIEDFFKNMITPQEWHSEQEKTDVLKFQNVLNTLQTSLTRPTVYRIGDTKKEVFIVGRLADGNVGGLKTYVVET
jgi:hypothetical protein